MPSVFPISAGFKAIPAAPSVEASPAPPIASDLASYIESV